MSDLVLKNVSKSFGDVEVIKEVDLAVERGEFVVFVGPSGCGKSTLLRMIAGLEDISSGELWINGTLCNEVEPRDRGIAMVFQSYALYPHMNVYDNVGFGLKLAGVPKAERDSKVRAAAKILQMEELLDRKPSQLSGGQRQRVAIGRAIVREPQVFLFDEPLSNLDAALRADMRIELAQLHQDIGATMIYVTHDQVEAMTMADKIVVLKDGIVQQIGSPLGLYNKPANLFVAGFMGAPKMNFINVKIASESKDSLALSGPSLNAEISIDRLPGVSKGDSLTLGVRPHNLVADNTGPIQGEVVVVERLGNESLVTVRLKGSSNWIAALASDSELKPGETLNLSWNKEDSHIFMDDGNVVETADS